MRTLKDFLKATVSWTLVLIPLSAIFTGLIIFVSNVLMGNESSFLQLWRSSYLIPWTILMFLNTGSAIYRYVRFALLSKRLGRSFKSIETAVLKHSLYKKLPVDQWTQEWFDLQFAIAETVEDLTDAIMERFSKRTR